MYRCKFRDKVIRGVESFCWFGFGTIIAMVFVLMGIIIFQLLVEVITNPDWIRSWQKR